MLIQVYFKGMDPNEELRFRAHNRMQHYFERFGANVSWVGLTIEDVNGPNKGGVDISAQVTIRGPRMSTVAIDEPHQEALAAVELALDRAARVVSRQLERRRELPIRRRAARA